jgi:hypothetical protein
LDGTQVTNILRGEFLGSAGNEYAYIEPDKIDVAEISLKFSSTRPVSSVIRLKVSDESGREYFFSVTVTADNSLFTCYAFLADHHAEYHIVLEPGHIMKGANSQKITSSGINEASLGEPLLRPFTGTSKYSNGRTVSPTFDMNAGGGGGSSPLKDVIDANGHMTPFRLG